MNLIEKLIRIDKETLLKKETKTVKSARLSKIVGEETNIVVKELSGRKLNDISAMMVDKDGDKDFSKLTDVNLMYCVEGVVEPNLRDTNLMEHFGVKTPKDLAEILFDAEAGKIAGKIISLSGISDVAEEYVKKSLRRTQTQA